MASTKKLIKRIDQLLDRVETLLPTRSPQIDWHHTAYRWRDGHLQGVTRPHHCELDDLLCMAAQKAEVVRNTAQFVAGQPANNVLLWGARGTGKSTLIKAVFNAFVGQGLRLIEVEAKDLAQLPEIVEPLYQQPERFILYCDDLSFEADDPSYKGLKAILEGSIAAPPDNLLIYATSNRRHLMPEFQRENQESQLIDGEIHPGEGVEEKISLSERFGLWLSFYPFTQDEYLSICEHWRNKLAPDGGATDDFRQAAIQWALKRGSRSGRVARQFVIDWLGRT